MTETVLAEPFSHEPFWWQDARPRATPESELPDSTDVVVIGSGYAGLSSAFHLGRAGLSVTVLDAGDIGSGASSRAAGFVSGRAGVSKQINLEKAVGRDHAIRILEEADDAYQHLQTLIREENIDCDFKACGRFVAAHTPAAYDKIAAKAEEYDFDGKNRFEMIPRAEQGRYIKSDCYFGGMATPDAGSLHPAKYHAGLVRLCLEAGVRLIGKTRAQSITRTGGHALIRTSRGPIRAREVMLGTGGYTDRLSPWHRRRIIPMSSTVIATETLGRETVDALLPAGCPVIDAKRVIAFARPSPDGEHILFGGRARFTPVSPEESVRILHAQMRKVFPELSRTRITHAWSGFMAFTFDFLPKVGVHQDLHYAMACNGGAGIVMMSWLGRRAAQNILGTANRPSAFETLPFPAHPLYSGTPWFVPIMGNWYRFRDWLDMRALRRN